MEHNWIMCSEQEGRDRESQGDLHPFECTDMTKCLPPSLRKVDPKLCVHKFFRSDSEDRHSKYPRRSIDQLQMTLAHLLNLWLRFHKLDDIQSCYGFLIDRCNAIRQEMVTFNTAAAFPAEVLSIHSRILRFYLHSYYVCPAALLSPSIAASPWYDEHLHESSMNSCTATALAIYPQLSEPPEVAIITDIIRASALLLQTFVALKRAISHLASAPGINLEPLISPIHLPSNWPNRDTAASSPYLMTAWDMVALLRGGNITRLLRTIESLQAHCEHEGELDGKQFLYAIGMRMLPLLWLWRLLLADKVANKDEDVPTSRLAKMLCLRMHTEIDLEPVLDEWRGDELSRVLPAPPSDSWDERPLLPASAPREGGQGDTGIALNRKTRTPTHKSIQRILNLFSGLAKSSYLDAT